MGTKLPGFEGVRSLAFDLMGTCVDWHTGITSALRKVVLPPADPSKLALEWRAGFFRSILNSFERKEPAADIDVIHRKILDEILLSHEISLADVVKDSLVRAWHRQKGWSDTVEGLRQLKRLWICEPSVVLANGTTRLQLDIVTAAELPFHTLFSSQLLGYTKPDPLIYERCTELRGRQPGEVAMVAAHVYDLRAAKNAGLKTIYIHRDTEDTEEDMNVIRSEVDLFIDGREGSGGLIELAELLS